MVLGGGVGGNLDDFDGQLDDHNGFSDDPSQDPVNFSVSEHLKALSWRGKLTLVYVAAVLIVLLKKCDLVIALMALLAFLMSAAPLYLWWARIRFSCPLDLVVRSFGLGIIGMFWPVMIILYVAFAMLPFLMVIQLLFDSALATTSVMSIVIVGVEEMVKVALAHWSKRDVAIGRETKAHQIAATATSVGYAVGFSFIMISMLDSLVDQVLHIKPDSWSDVVVGLFALAITTVFGTPLHVLSGYLIGLEVTRQTHFMKAALYSFGLRSLFLINIILWITFSKSWQMIVFGILMTNIVLCAVMVRRIKQVESTLPVEYLQRVGYLQAFGYGVLPGGDVDEVEIPGSFDVNTLV